MRLPWQRKKARTAAEDVRMMLLYAADQVEKAAPLHHLERQRQVVNTLTAAIVALQEKYPSFRAEEEGMAMTLLRCSAEGTHHEDIEASIDHLLAQLGQAEGREGLRLAVMHWVFRPSRTEALLEGAGG